MKSIPNSVRFIFLGIILTLVALLPLASFRLASANSMATGKGARGAHPAVLSLSTAALAPPLFYTSYTVNSLSDTGAGSGTTGDLRYCINQANAAMGMDTITFSVTGTITVASALPAIIDDLTIDGPGANLLTINGNNFAVVFNIPNNKIVNLNGLTITGGNGTNLVAGGINNSGTLTINGCHITGNAGKFSGGIQNLKSLTILNSTISNNTATISAPPSCNCDYNNGGGMSQSNNGTLVMTNCTISGNTATARGNGNGGILIYDGTATITNCTVTDNQGSVSDGIGGLRRNFGSLTVRNSIVAANRNNSTMADVGGGLTSQGYNLIGNVGSESFLQAGDQTGTGAAPLDPQIDALANNGGTTPTHALRGGSLAIDKGSSFGSTTDQRGLARTFNDTGIAPATGGDNTDIGAFEAQTVLLSLGNYPNTSVALGANTVIAPTAAPLLTTGISVSTSTKFKGTLTANPLTGVVRVTNAHPAGTYTVKVNAFGAGAMASRTFTLTVQNGTPCANPLAFVNAPNVAISPYSTSVAIGDFNEDGRQDFVTGYDSFDPLSVRFGDGTGNFSGTTTVSAAPFVRSIAVGDFNEDGHQDFASSNNSGVRSVSIRLGDGAGNFSGTLDVPVGAIPASVAIGDFNGDGHQDFATANSIDNTVSIRFGDGAGNFSGTTEISVGLQPISIAIGDFNGDGKQDFATANSSATTVSIRLGDGLGGFANADVTFSNTPQFVALGDFNGDNKQDLAVSMSNVNIISVRLGDGAGGFTGTTDVPVSSGPMSVAIGDFNNDGKQDFVTSNIGFGTLSIRLGDGAGNFTGFTPTSEVSVGNNPRFVAVGDFNGDTMQDFAVVHFNASNFGAIRLNNSCPPPNTPPTITAVAPLSRQQDAAASNSKIATVNDIDQTENTLTVTATPLTGTGVTISNIVVAANGDVTADVAAACAATNSTFTLTVTDNQMATATATLTVNVTLETTPPTITCPVNLVRSNDAGQCSAVVTYTTPTATDNCPGATVVCNPASGATFVKGTTTVTCTATDASSNTASCTFTVTVNDTQAPTVACPANIVKANDPNQCSAVVTYTTPTASDNCSGVGTVTCSPASGATFVKGTTTVTCSVTDASSNSGSCSFTVTVNDTQAPTVACPANLTRGTDANLCSAVVTYTTPTATDNCPGIGAVTCSPVSGTAFAKGTTTVTCAVQDASNNQAACAFTVTVNDTQNPTVTCPANIVKANDPNQCSAVATFSATASDNCSGVGSVSCNPPSGTAFAKGTTTVTCSVTDASSNSGSCSFTVTVNDTQAPTIACPTNIVKANDPNQCSAVVTYTTPTASDNCSGVGSVTCAPTSGSTFPKGTTTVTCTVQDATSNSGSCTFTVTVNDTQNPTVTCPANIVKANDPNQCSAVATFSATASDNCSGVGSVSCNPPSGTAFAKGTTTVTCSVTDASSNSGSCSFTVTVNDTQAPTVTCPANVTQATEANQCQAVVAYGKATATDNCSGVGSVSCSPTSGSTFPKGTTTVTCTVQDATSNSGSCTFTVTVNDTQNPTVTCPANIVKANDPNQCSAVATFSATASDNCPGATVSCSPASGAAFPKGTTTVTCTATDSSNNQSAPCSFTVTVNDTQAPVIACPANISSATDPNQCSAMVAYATPTATDNCPGIGAVTCSPVSGTAFAKGTTTVTCAVQDASNNQAACAFTVTVNDAQLPVITCPANQLRPLLNPTDSTVLVTYPAPTFSDNCPGTTVVCAPPSGSAFPLGTTTVTCTATDSSGNKVICSFTVTIFDVCLQDDSNPTSVLLFNSFTGDYLFCSGGTTFTGRGTVQKLGSTYTLTHNTSERRVLGRLEGALNRGTASLQWPVGTTRCTINDRDVRNNSCLCN